MILTALKEHRAVLNVEWVSMKSHVAGDGARYSLTV